MIPYLMCLHFFFFYQLLKRYIRFSSRCVYLQSEFFFFFVIVYFFFFFFVKWEFELAVILLPQDPEYAGAVACFLCYCAKRF